MTQMSTTLLVNASEKPRHQKCLKFVNIEFYKYFNGLLHKMMNDIFKLRKIPNI